MFKYLHFTPLEKQSLLFSFVVKEKEIYPFKTQGLYCDPIYFRTKAI